MREDLNKRALRDDGRGSRSGGDRQLPQGQVEEMEAVNNPEDAGAGTRRFRSQVLFIEQDDFREDPPKQFFRLSPGREVRLRYGYFIACTGVVKDAGSGEILEIHCTYDPATRGGNAPDGRKVKSTIHWVSAAHAISAEVRIYDTLFTTRPQPGGGRPGLHGQPESPFARSDYHRQAGTRPGECGAGRCINLSAWDTSAWTGFHARSGLQLHRGAARYLGQIEKGGKAEGTATLWSL